MSSVNVEVTEIRPVLYVNAWSIEVTEIMPVLYVKCQCRGDGI